nr:GH3 auxin-responsive promoter family protein [Chitinophagales bacterium]
AQETLSAFGEHVILDEIHKVLSLFSKEFNVEVLDFAVLVDTKLARYEYILELSETIQNTDSIASFLDEALCAQNPYYSDLRKNKTLASFLDEALCAQNPYYSDLRKNKTLSYPIVHILPQNTLMTYRENIGKVGGQLKIKRLFTDFQFPFI